MKFKKKKKKINSKNVLYTATCMKSTYLYVEKNWKAFQIFKFMEAGKIPAKAGKYFKVCTF